MMPFPLNVSHPLMLFPLNFIVFDVVSTIIFSCIIMGINSKGCSLALMMKG